LGHWDAPHVDHDPLVPFSNALAPVINTTVSSNSRRTRIAELRAAAPLIAPSLLQCDFTCLASEIEKLQAASVRLLHLDVMDGHFVPNFTYGLTIVEAANRATDLLLDVHLMISQPERWIEPFYTAGASSMTIHIEAVPEPRAALEQIRSLGAAAGLALNPGTPLEAIEPYLDACDLVLVMSVEPGFGGQSFNPVALDKLRRLRTLVGPNVLLEIDGGVNQNTIGRCAEAGAHLFVVGSAIFGTSNYAESVTNLSRLATNGSG
jgi:ribulose-phosphate 3-epimerase